MKKKQSSLLDKAREIATNAHRGQVDKSGSDYIQHPSRVSAKGNTEAEQIVGLLHDVVEDTAVTLQDLSEASFPQEILDAIDCLTKRKGEDDVHYLLRVKGNDLARNVKLHDIADNTDPIRLDKLSASEREVLIAKYRRAKSFLHA